MEINQLNIILNELRNQLESYPPLYSRHWEVLAPRTTANQTVSLMQWNLLADGLSGSRKDKGGFISVPLDCLSWEFRKKRILEEILRFNCDILCFEEIDHYHDVFEPVLSSLGYDSIFYPKPHSKCSPPDGIACFYRSNYIKKLDEFYLNFPHPGNDQIALRITFQIHSQTFDLIITHLKSEKNNNGEKIRMEQMKYLLENVKTSKRHIIVGDFNSSPNDTNKNYPSLVYPLLNNLKSAYSTNNIEPSYTTWKIRTNEDEIKHTIDYIMFTPLSIKCLQKLSIPLEKDIDDCRLPSYRYPSDHFSLCIKFELIEKIN